MAHVLVFKSDSKKQIWMTASKSWHGFDKSKAIQEYKRFTSAAHEKRSKMVEINHLAKQMDLQVEFIASSDLPPVQYKKVLKGEYANLGYTVLGRP